MLMALANSWWMQVLRGLAALLLGSIACTQPGITVSDLALLYSGYALLDGGLAILGATAAFRADVPWGVILIDGGVGVTAGLAAFPASSMMVPALIRVMAPRAIMTGVVLVITAGRLRTRTAVEWLPAFAGTASILFGAIAMATPVTGTFDLTIGVGIYMCLIGPLLIAF
jgi:uncharacterized membrane protein HdeD (DUF308 family)